MKNGDTRKWAFTASEQSINQFIYGNSSFLDP